MSKSVIVNLQGGLGNQLFQYAAGLSVAHYNKSELYLPLAQANKHSGRDYRERLYIRAKCIENNNNENEKYTYIDHYEGFNSWDPKGYTDIEHVRLNGYYQYLPSIELQIPIIKQDLLNKLSDIRNELIKKYNIINKKDMFFLHVRRNDYLFQEHDTLFVQDKLYYITALDKLKLEDKKLYILSDDVQWCKEQEWLQKNNFQIVDEPDELYGLMLMSLCEGGAIIANSTYSWWGAVLGCGFDNSFVYYPTKWFSHKKINLFSNVWNPL
jgi:hypothetical protein